MLAVAQVVFYRMVLCLCFACVTCAPLNCCCSSGLLLQLALLVHHQHHHHPESSPAKQPDSVDKQCAVSVLTVFAEFAAVPELAVFQLAVFAGGSMSALEGEGQPSGAGVEPAGLL